MKIFLWIFLCFVFTFGRSNFGSNYTGTGDTSNITDFRADSLKYSRTFKKSKYFHMIAEVLVNDTSSAGFSADSTYFAWGIQTGHPVLDSANNLDTAWNEEMLVCDTVTRYDSSYAPTYIEIPANGNFDNVLKVIDTTSVTGFAKQSHNPSPNWDVLFRGWAQGIAGNEEGSFLIFRFNFPQQVEND